MKKVGQGVLPIPRESRYAGVLTLFWLWAGGNVLLATFMVGSSYSTSLGLIPSIVVTVFANLAAYTVCAWSSQRSAKYGVDEFITIRPTFGYKGSIIGIFILVGINFGWIGMFSSMTGSATQVVMDGLVPGFSFAGDYSVYSLGVGILIPLLLIILNPKSGFLLANITVPLLILTSIYILIKIVSSESWVVMKEYEPTNEVGWAFAFEACVAFAVAWFPYLGAWNKFAKSTRAAYWATFLGLAFIGILFGVIGAFATIITGEIDPSVWATQLNLGLSALYIVILGTVTSVALLLYAGSMAVLSIFPTWNYRVVASFLGIPSILLIYVPSLQALFSYVLIFVGLLAGTYWAVVMADYFILRKSTINIKECFNPNGIYKYFNGFNWIAFVSQLVGMVFWLYIGGWQLGIPFLSFESGAVLFSYISATIPAMLLAGGTYVVLAKQYFKGKTMGGYHFSDLEGDEAEIKRVN